jgi:hypothetical protein
MTDDYVNMCGNIMYPAVSIIKMLAHRLLCVFALSTAHVFSSCLGAYAASTAVALLSKQLCCCVTRDVLVQYKTLLELSCCIKHSA